MTTSLYDVKLVREHDRDWCTTWRDLAPIWLARRQTVLFADAWPRPQTL